MPIAVNSDSSEMEWIVWRLAAQHDRGSASWPSDSDWTEIRRECPNYQRASETLSANGLITKKGQLTEAGHHLLNTLRARRLGQDGPAPDLSEPRVRYGAFATHPAVIADKTFFAKQSKRVRKILAAEMEVASLFSAAAEIRTLAFAVKGVSDYGTPSKDDLFHTYAAEASACWMRAFIRRHGAILASLGREASRRPRAQPDDPQGGTRIRREAASEILVLVAQFSGSAAYNPTDRVYRSLADHVLEVVPEIGRVERLEIVVVSRAEAIAAARLYDASIIVWGTYDDLGIAPRYEITRDSLVIRRSMIQLDQATRHRLRDAFEPYITDVLSEELSFLSLLAVGHICLLNLNAKAAVEVLERAVSLVHGDERRKTLGVHGAYESLASAYMALRRYDSALAANARGLDVDPDDITLLLQRIALLTAAQQNAEIAAARERLSRRLAREAPDSADESAVEAIRVLISNKTLSDLQREIFKSQKEAFAEWQNARSQGRYNKDAAGHMAKAFAALSQFKIHEAIQAADAAFRLNPLLGRALNLKVLALSGLGKTAEAWQVSLRAEKIDPADPMVFWARAAVYRAQRAYESALHEMERAITAGMPKGIAADAIADCLILLDRDEEAMRFLQENALDPDSSLVFEFRARYHLKRGALSQALEDIERSMSVDDRSPYSFRTRGDIYIRMGKLAKARDDFNRAKMLVRDSVIDQQEIDDRLNSLPR